MLATEVTEGSRFLLLPVDLQSLPVRPSCDEQRSSSWPQLLPSPDWLLLVDSLLPGLKAALGGLCFCWSTWRGFAQLPPRRLVQCSLCKREEPVVLTNSPGLYLCRFPQCWGPASESREHKQQITTFSSILCWLVHNIKYFAFTAILNLSGMSTYPQDNLSSQSIHVFILRCLLHIY